MLCCYHLHKLSEKTEAWRLMCPPGHLGNLLAEPRISQDPLRALPSSCFPIRTQHLSRGLDRMGLGAKSGPGESTPVSLPWLPSPSFQGNPTQARRPGQRRRTL